MNRSKYPDSDASFDHAPYFNFNDGKVKFDTNRVDNANDNYGSASGFVPNFLLMIKVPLFGCFYFKDFIHPPSILPISSTSLWIIVYFLLSIAFTSFISLTNTRNKFS